jgi:hypothetical protein
VALGEEPEVEVTLGQAEELKRVLEELGERPDAAEPRAD